MGRGVEGRILKENREMQDVLAGQALEATLQVCSVMGTLKVT